MSFFCPFSGAAQAGMSVSAQGGAKQKRVPFSRPGLAGTMAMTTGGRMLPACDGLLDARLVSVCCAARGRMPSCGRARHSAGCAVRRSSLVRYGIRTILTRRSQRKKRKDGGT